MSLPVATLRSQRLFSPLSFITVSTYFASGDMAATTARLELVTWVMAKFWKGAETRGEGWNKHQIQPRPELPARRSRPRPLPIYVFLRRRSRNCSSFVRRWVQAASASPAKCESDDDGPTWRLRNWLRTALRCDRNRSRTRPPMARIRFPFQPLQVGTHLRRALIAQLAVFLQCLVDDAFQFGGHVGIQPHGGRRFRIQNGFEDDRGAIARERASCPSPSRKARRQRRTNQCARPVLWPAPAPATCRQRCPAPCRD